MIFHVRATRFCTAIVLRCWVGLAFAYPAVAQVRAPSQSVDWTDLISFRPPAAIQRAIGDRDGRWHVQPIENARGEINLDYYPLQITRLPLRDGRRLSPAQFMTDVRVRFGDIIDPSMASFEAYDAAEHQRFISAHPLGAVMVFHIKGGLTGGTVNSGAVVLSEVTPQRWRFSTVHAAVVGGHPISGTREWSLIANGDGSYCFATRAADRTTGPIDHLMHRVVFSSADRFWLDFVSRVADDINAHGGEAHLDPALCSHQRLDWSLVQAVFQPTIPWVSPLEVDQGAQRQRAMWTTSAPYRLAHSRK